MPKFYLQTFGCQMNEYDSDRIVDLMCAANFELVGVPGEADLIILNTCAIREKAGEKVFSRLGELRLLKKNNPKLLFAVGGCLAVLDQDKIFRRVPEVNFIFGPATLHFLPEWYYRYNRILQVEGESLDKFGKLPPPGKRGVSAFISIMEGCNNYCSYCVVPRTRGKERSRAAEDILREAEILLGQGVKELHLIGQNVNGYRDPVNGLSLAGLLKKLATYSDVERLRFTTSHPRYFSEDLIAVYAEEPKVVNQLHLPVQSGSERILQAMRRGYTLDMYRKIVEQLRKFRSNLSLTTDFIVGFPGESEVDFEATLSLVESLRFDQSYSFIFSKRPGTKAALLLDDLPEDEKKKRLGVLQHKLEKYRQDYSQQMLRTVQSVLVEKQRNIRGQCRGRTENNRVVNFVGPDFILGKMTKVKITEVLTNSLRGENIE